MGRQQIGEIAGRSPKKRNPPAVLGPPREPQKTDRVSFRAFNRWLQPVVALKAQGRNSMTM